MNIIMEEIGAVGAKIVSESALIGARRCFVLFTRVGALFTDCKDALFLSLCSIFTH